MNNVIDEVLAGEPRYTIKDNGGTTLYDNVQIDLKTQVTTAGTPLNKALFDSIQTDLNSRLLISNKATQAEVQTGTNNVKYITPYALKGKIDKISITGGCTTITAPPHNTDVFDFTQYTNKTILITGTLTVSNNTDSANFCRMYIYDGSTRYDLARVESREKGTSFFLYVDTKYKTAKLEFLRDYSATTETTGQIVETHFYKLPNLAKINMVYNGTNTAYDLTCIILD